MYKNKILPPLRHTLAMNHSPLQGMKAAWNDVSVKIPEVDLSMSNAKVKKLLKRSVPNKDKNEKCFFFFLNKYSTF